MLLQVRELDNRMVRFPGATIRVTIVRLCCARGEEGMNLDTIDLTAQIGTGIKTGSHMCSTWIELTATRCCAG